MEADAVKALITTQLPEIEVLVETDGYHYQVTAIGEMFEGLSAVKKQQVIYQCLNQQIIDGTIHAVVIKTYTPTQWSALNN